MECTRCQSCHIALDATPHNFNILKTTPTPPKNGSHGARVGVRVPQKSEFVCHKSRFVHHILCESAFISRDLYAIRPLILWHILGAYFLQIWRVGVVKIVSQLSIKLESYAFVSLDGYKILGSYSLQTL